MKSTFLAISVDIKNKTITRLCFGDSADNVRVGGENNCEGKPYEVFDITLLPKTKIQMWLQSLGIAEDIAVNLSENVVTTSYANIIFPTENRH